MEQHQPEPPAYIERVQQLNQAMFYCYNESSDRLPVSRVVGFTFGDDKTLHFKTNYFPVTENAWNVFAAELHFYKKGIQQSLVLHGVAVIDLANDGLVQFSIKDASYFQQYASQKDKGLFSSLFKPYIYFYKKSSELFQHTFRRKNATGYFQ